MTSSPSGWNSSFRQRDRMVGSKRPGTWLTSRKRHLAGGSSSILSKALAADASRSSAASITTTRQSDIAGVTENRSPSSRDLIDADVALRARCRSCSRSAPAIDKSGWLPAAIRRAVGWLVGSFDPFTARRRPAASANKRSAAAWRNSLCPARADRSAARHDASHRCARRRGTSIDRAIVPLDHGSRSPSA